MHIPHLLMPRIATMVAATRELAVPCSQSSHSPTIKSSRQSVHLMQTCAPSAPTEQSSSPLANSMLKVLGSTRTHRLNQKSTICSPINISNTYVLTIYNVEDDNNTVLYVYKYNSNANTWTLALRQSTLAYFQDIYHFGSHYSGF